MGIKKKNITNLIKAFSEGDDSEFRSEAYNIAREFALEQDEETANYILSLLTDVNSFVPQDFEFKPQFLVKQKNEVGDLLFPTHIKEVIRNICNAISNKSEIRRFLFIGRPGTGKTEAVKMVAHILNYELYSANLSSIVDSRLGQTAKNIDSIFREINTLASRGKFLFVFDEIDAIALDRISSRDIREMGRVTSTFLKNLEELNADALIFATTNLYEQMDKAMARRFDYKVNFDQYTRKDLEEISQYILTRAISENGHIEAFPQVAEKIFANAEDILMPGDMKNIIRASLAFADHETPGDYLRRIALELGEQWIDDAAEMRRRDFTYREIELLTGQPKSSVARAVAKELA